MAPDVHRNLNLAIAALEDLERHRTSDSDAVAEGMLVCVLAVLSSSHLQLVASDGPRRACVGLSMPFLYMQL